MTGPWKIGFAAAVVTAVLGVVVGIAAAGTVPEPEVGTPVVITPSDSPEPGTTTPRSGPDDDDDGPDGDGDGDDWEDDDEIRRSPQPWDDTEGDTDRADELDGGDDNGNRDNTDDRGDDADDRGDDD